MLHDKQKVICHTLIMVVAFTIVLFGSYYSSSSSVSAFSLQSPIHHHKVFDKKQGSDSSSSSDTKRSDNSDNNGNSNNNNDDSNKNNNQGTNDGSNTGTDNTFQAVEPAKSGEQQQQGSGENIAPIEIATPKSKTICEQGSNCTDRSTTDAATTKQDDNTPFVLSLPFP
jgi:hypothetical protein